METNHLHELVSRYHENRDFITNEETVKMALVVPFIRALGYSPNQPREVRLEFSAEFTQGDGKKLRDRMDFAIFDKSGIRPLIVIETKPLETDLPANSQQLARYIAQMPELHFGIITDGCKYLFYGDLENPNQMDQKPFFSFALDDPKTDWSKVAKFLSKFSRDSFNAETLVTDAENSHYRQSMTDKITNALKDPAKDEGFLRWLTTDIYKGHRTASVKARLAEVAKESIEPALMRIIGDEFLDKLKERIQQHKMKEAGSEVTSATDQKNEDEISEKETKDISVTIPPRKGIVTTPEELKFFEIVREICTKVDAKPDSIQYRDTTNYFNVSYDRPTKWFVRFFGDAKRKNVVTLVPTEEAKQIANGFEIENAPDGFGVSRIYIESVEQLWALKDIITKSLELVQVAKTKQQPFDDSAKACTEPEPGQ